MERGHTMEKEDVWMPITPEKPIPSRPRLDSIESECENHLDPKHSHDIANCVKTQSLSFADHETTNTNSPETTQNDKAQQQQQEDKLSKSSVVFSHVVSTQSEKENTKKRRTLNFEKDLVSGYHDHLCSQSLSSTPQSEFGNEKDLTKNFLVYKRRKLRNFNVNILNEKVGSKSAEPVVSIYDNNLPGYLHGSLKIDATESHVSNCKSKSINFGQNFPSSLRKKRSERKKVSDFKTYPITAADFGQRPVKSCIMNEITISHHASRNTKILAQMISPPKEQASTIINDLKNFECLHSLRPLVKSRRKRYKGITPSRTLAIKGISKEDFQKLEGHHINDEFGELVPRGRKLDPSKKRELAPKVSLDKETLRVWNLMEKGESGVVKEDEDGWWKEERKVICERVASFITLVRPIQGNKPFSPWKGSVVDSVVGAYLTQNVTDHLSSSAFMSLAARFPIRSTISSTSNNREYDDNVGNSFVGSFFDGSQKMTHTPSIIEYSTDEIYSREKILFRDDSQVVGNIVSRGLKKEKQTLGTRNKKKGKKTLGSRREKGEVEEKQQKPNECDGFRKIYSGVGTRETTGNIIDSVDWERVRRAKVKVVAKTIEGRGMNNVIAKRMKECLNDIVKDQKSCNLEKLRNLPPHEVKAYLLKIYGMGMKSVECIRLLTFHHLAFPVDTNAGRVAVRLGWVPLKPLLKKEGQEEVPIHLLKRYPHVNTVQQYLWPRLCTLDHQTLYELHCQLITFGKLFCTKRKPNCKACPMRGECKHYASALASTKLAVPPPGRKGKNMELVPYDAQNPVMLLAPPSPSFPHVNISDSRNHNQNIEPIIDMEDFLLEPDVEIPTIKFKNPLLEKEEGRDMSKALVVSTAEDTLITIHKFKPASCSMTWHHVYELPDSHPLLAGFDPREPEDPCPYLLAVWMEEKGCNSHESEVCDENSCFSCGDTREQNPKKVSGTILIPSRTAVRGRFPLNGTYFQVNEVFADDESSEHPIDVPRESIWHLPRRTLYCGTSVSALCRGLSTEEIQSCFLGGFMCVRGFDRTTRAPRPLRRRFHHSKTAAGKTAGKTKGETKEKTKATTKSRKMP